MKARWLGAWLAAAACICTGHAQAQALLVEAVQFPAWLERDGQAVPLVPGTQLRASDRLRTGGNARVVLRMGEGSVVKLGERTQFSVERVEPRNVFEAVLRLIAGAVRFTTDPTARDKRREVTLHVKTLMAGIRGTDVWGKSADDRDLVCLLEGRVEVAEAGQAPVTLDRPLDYYAKERDAAAVRSHVDPAELARWSKQTELADDGPVGRMGGGWRVVAGKFEQRDAALMLRRVLRARGYPAEIAGPDAGIFRVQVRGLAGEMQARALMADLRSIPGVTIPMVGPTPAR